MPVATKKYNIKIYDSDGVTHIQTIKPDLLKAPPTFSQEINGGYGECQLDFSLNFDDFGEGDAIAFMNIVKIYAIDSENQTGRLIYTGFISQYKPYIRGADQGVEVNLLGLVSLLQLAYYKNGANFTVTHSADDPADIIKAIIDHFNSIYAGSLVTYAGGQIDNIGTVVDLEFVGQKWLEAIKQTAKLADGGWWWKVAEDGEFYLKEKPATATHAFTIGKDVEQMTVTKTSETVLNNVTVEYDGGSTSSSNAGSQTEFGKREKLISDTSLKDANAGSQRAQKELNDFKDDKVSATLIINSAYDIESVKAGDTCTVRNLKLGSTLFGDNMQIVKVKYYWDKIEITLEAIRSDFGVELTNFITS